MGVVIGYPYTRIYCILLYTGMRVMPETFYHRDEKLISRLYLSFTHQRPYNREMMHSALNL